MGIEKEVDDSGRTQREPVSREYHRRGIDYLWMYPPLREEVVVVGLADSCKVACLSKDTCRSAAYPRMTTKETSSVRSIHVTSYDGRSSLVISSKEYQM